MPIRLVSAIQVTYVSLVLFFLWWINTEDHSKKSLTWEEWGLEQVNKQIDIAPGCPEIMY